MVKHFVKHYAVTSFTMVTPHTPALFGKLREAREYYEEQCRNNPDWHGRLGVRVVWDDGVIEYHSIHTT